MTTKYPEDMESFIRSICWHRSSEEITALVNEHYGREVITVKNLRAYKKSHHITTGLTGQFEKGRVPYTKGKKQTDYMSPEAIERTKATRFKKGDRPVNELPIGSIVKNVEGYLLRKKSMTGSQWERWEFLHRAVWEENYGPIPRGLCVTFKNGNKEDCSIENLMLIDNNENLTLTRLGLRSDVAECTEAGLNVAKLDIKIRERGKA